jgi:hypothetical protein
VQFHIAICWPVPKTTSTDCFDLTRVEQEEKRLTGAAQRSELTTILSLKASPDIL